MATKLTDKDAIILAAIFARSNMGQGRPSIQDVARAKASANPSISGMVSFFCGNFMETDEHQAMFEDEARSWYKGLKRDTAEYIKKVHPDIGALYWSE